MAENKWVTGVITPLTGVTTLLIASTGSTGVFFCVVFPGFLEYYHFRLQHKKNISPHQVFGCRGLVGNWRELDTNKKRICQVALHTSLRKRKKKYIIVTPKSNTTTKNDGLVSM